MTRNYLDILAETIRNNWDAPALTDFYLTEDGSAQDTSRGNHYTYGEMYTEVCRVANCLHDCGLRKGDHIAICGANSAHWVIAYLAIAKIQGVSVTVMQTLKPEEIARQIDFSDAKALFTAPDLWAKLAPLHQPCMGDLSSVISLADWSILHGEKNTNYQLQITNGEIGFSPVEPDSLAMICFTSGSTECSKAVLLPNRTISVNFSFVERTIPDYKGEQALIFLPLAHVMGQLLLSPLFYGCHSCVLSGSITADSLMAAIAHVKPYLVVIVPLLAEKLFESSNLNSLKKVPYFILGGAIVSDEQIRYLLDNGIKLSAGYGLSETGGMVSLSSPDKYRAKSVGTISATTKIRISPEGEILVKGENVMLGYYKDPGATARKIDSDGWLHTGDKGYLDEDGYLYVEGRLEQDIIVLPNGENIRPDNIESIINALPEVKESIVLARDGKLVAIVVPQITNHQSQITNTDLRRMVLRTINPQLPLYSQLYDVEITDTPLARTEKQTLKRYLYK